jgi:hypothetical protein
MSEGVLQATGEQILALSLGWLNRWFMILVFRTSLIRRAYSRDEIDRMASDAGWTQPQVQATLLGFEASMSK